MNAFWRNMEGVILALAIIAVILFRAGRELAKPFRN